MIVRVGGVNQTIDRGLVQIGGSPRSLTSMLAHIGGTTYTVATFVQPLSLDIDPDAASAFIERTDGSPSSQNATTNSVTATPTGGRGPFTYVWTQLSGDSFTINNPNSATTTFTASLLPDDSKSGVAQCEVTDVFGTISTDTVPVSFDSISSGGL